MKGVLLSVIAILSAFIVAFGFSCYYSYFYPTRYQQEIYESSERFNLEPSLIASVINVESSYNKNAVSGKGAIGLMQVLPSTAEWVCEKLGKDFAEEMLFEPSQNIVIGSFYLSYLLDYFKDEGLAICAYNAGMGNVKKWLSNVEYSSSGKTLDKIPFKETKNYLEKVQKNQLVYKNKF